VTASSGATGHAALVRPHWPGQRGPGVTSRPASRRGAGEPFGLFHILANRAHSEEKNVEILITRNGGFAGLDEEVAHVHTEELDPQQAADLQSRLEDVDFYALPSELPSEFVGTDQFTYSITVSGDQGSHTVSYQDDGTGSSVAAHVGEIVSLVLGNSLE
jgi:hypothetical protein